MGIGPHHGDLSDGMNALKSWPSLLILGTSISLFVVVRKIQTPAAVRGMMFAPARGEHQLASSGMDEDDQLVRPRAGAP